MLKNITITFKFLRFIQTGFYVDFFFKKLIEIFVRNWLIYSSLFLGEKYIIEFLTKKIIDSGVTNINKYTVLFELSMSYYFIQLVGFIFYFLTLINLTIYIL
jgi:hypothetical protein